MEEKYYNLTHRQKEIWYMEKIYPNTSIGVIGGIFRMKGITDFKLFSDAINNFIKSNDAMRFRLCEVDGNVKQYISQFSYYNIEFKDFSNKSKEDFYLWEQEHTLEPMELIEKPLFRFVMIKFSDDEGGFYIKIHHTIADAWAMTILVNEIADNYFKLENGTYFDNDKPSYISYIEKEEEYEKTEKYKKDKLYWMEKYNDEPEIIRLKEKTKKNISARAKRKTFLLPEKLCEKIYEYSKANKISVFSMYMSALSIYINRIKGKSKINVGTIILNRANKSEKNTMGMFVTTAPVLLSINNNDNFMNFSKDVTKEMMILMRHQNYPFDVLQEEIREKFKIDDVLYDVVLSYQNARFLDKDGLNEYKTRWSFCGYQTNSLTIHINDRDNEGKLIIDYDYLVDVFYDKEIEFIHKHIEAILWHALDNPLKPMKSLNMVSENEKNKILYDFNNTSIDYPKDKVIYELVEEMANTIPDKKAVIFENSSITYKELINRSNIIANKLRDLGVVPNTIVGIMVHRSIDMMVSLLGIIKSGAAYLPIDPEYPKDRIEYMLSDSKTNILITESIYKDFIKNENINKLFVDDNNFYAGSSKSLEVVNKPEDLMYVIYTSGSTGLPKGVMLSHKNVNNFIKGTCDVIDFSQDKNIASVTTISFDIFVLESWLALIKGLTVVLANEEEQNNSKSFNKMCVKNNVNMVQTTPSRMGILTGNEKYLDFAGNITDFMVGGEPFPRELLERLKNISNAKIYNMYGPTETTVWSSIKDLTNENKINIGRPIANTKMYILDSNMNLCPIGIMGDLYIAGDGVAKGYFEREELNNDRFIKNPYNPDEIIYKTGDLAKWMANGEIIHMGRNDSQVKIRGYRIELGDIQRNIVKLDGVKDAIIKAVGNNYLIAYLICDDSVTVSNIKEQLSKELPKYMIPSYFVKIDKLPYTPNGKVDINKLPDLDEAKIMREEFIKPETEKEKRLAKIWQKVLNIKDISIRDDFFNIGGDSLGAINLANIISDEFNITFSVKEVYDNSDIYRMARYIESSVKNNMVLGGAVLLKKADSIENLFFIHAGNGSAAPYARLCSKIIRDINCFAIPYPEDEIKEYPREITMDYIAELYVKIIRNIQPHGPYKLFGWCIGCNIIVEIIHKLEEINEVVDEVYLSAALSPLLDNEKKYFYPEVEKSILCKLITSEEIKEEIVSCKTVEDVWRKVIENCSKLEKESMSIRHRLEEMMLPLDITRAIPNYHSIDLKGVFKVLNIIRTVTAMDSFYEPNIVTDAKCYYFNPTNDVMLGDQQINKDSWAKIFSNISFIDIKGDHFSFFEKETDDEFIRILNNYLKKS